MEIINAGNLSEADKKELVKKITPYIKGVEATTIENINVNGRVITGRFSAATNSFAISAVHGKVKEANPMDEVLQRAIESGEVVKTNNWYEYKGENYNGKAKILAALAE